MKIGITGHREIKHDDIKIKEALKDLYVKNNADLIISGMALGFDTLAAEVAEENNIPYIAAIPFEEQAKLWSEKDKNKYLYLLERANDIYIQPEAKSGNKKLAGYFGRNQWIVSNTDLIIAYIEKYDKGGTAYTWQYAKLLQKKRINVIDYITS